MYTRAISTSFFSIFALLALASCGSGSKTNTPAPCTPGSVSVPYSPTDPCKQNDPMCPATLYNAVNTCQATGMWMPICTCMSKTAGAGGTASTPAQVCGNKVMEGTEKCDTGNVSAPVTTCAALGMGTGMVMCNITTCGYDTSMCKPATLGAGGA